MLHFFVDLYRKETAAAAVETLALRDVLAGRSGLSAPNTPAVRLKRSAHL